jgi:hypothetical protein
MRAVLRDTLDDRSFRQPETTASRPSRWTGHARRETPAPPRRLAASRTHGQVGSWQQPGLRRRRGPARLCGRHVGPRHCASTRQRGPAMELPAPRAPREHLHGVPGRRRTAASTQATPRQPDGGWGACPLKDRHRQASPSPEVGAPSQRTSRMRSGRHTATRSVR